MNNNLKINDLAQEFLDSVKDAEETFYVSVSKCFEGLDIELIYDDELDPDDPVITDVEVDKKNKVVTVTFKNEE